MNFIGINYGHNATVAIVKDGKLVFCQSEERLNRIKNSCGFPQLTVDYVYKNIISPEDIDYGVIYQNSLFGYRYLKVHGFKSFAYGQYLDPMLGGSTWREKLKRSRWGWDLYQRWVDFREKDPALRKEMMAYYSQALKLPEKKILTVDHHLAHAMCAVPNLKDEAPALIFSLDGMGDWKCATVNLYENGEMKTLDTTDYWNSFGFFYTGTTGVLGMKMSEHEFKVMGLAPYAKSKYYQGILKSLRDLIRIDRNGKWVCRISPHRLQERLAELYKFQRFDNVAGAIQVLTEELTMKWVEWWVNKTGVRNVGLTGGVFMNVKACQVIAHSGKVDKVFVMPSSGDESCAVGAAYWGSMVKDKEHELQPMKDLYLGMEFSDEEVETSLRESGAYDRYEITVPENINREVARLIAENEIVARCSGPMEWGARALGNRSILSNPSRFENLNIINEMIKSRDFWMPFAPSILEEDLPRYLVNHDRVFAPYMCITFDSTPEARKDLAAAVHPRDRTLRPQCVLPDWNPGYHEIIKTFKELTGIGGVLNTSFNLHGEPNVCSPEDAIHTIDDSGLKYLAMGKFLLRKKDQ